ncbi:FAD-binding oxidoreductase, partial [Nocardia seriolae]
MTLFDTSLGEFAGEILRPHDPDYEGARRVWNGAIDRRPAFIARCRTAQDVSIAVRFGVRHGLPIAVRGGGHSLQGLSTCEGGRLVDLSPMTGVRVEGSRAVVEPGVRWRDLDAATEAAGRAVPGGEISSTGVAGLTLDGGIGWLSRQFGLSCDNLLAAELVTADGSILEVDENRHPELLWGLRGGGGNFGIVTRFTLRLNEIPVPMFGGMVIYSLADARPALRAFLEVASAAPDALGLNAALLTAPPAPFIPEAMRGEPVVALAAGCTGPLPEAIELTKPLRTAANPIADLFGPMPYTVLQSMVDAGAPPGLACYARSEWLGTLDEGAIDALITAATELTSPLSQILLRVMGGAIARIPADATAFRFRSAESMLTLIAAWPDPADPGERHRDWARTAWERFRPYSAGGAYINHLSVDEPDRIRQAYGKSTWTRLVALKRQFDPDNVSRLSHFSALVAVTRRVRAVRSRGPRLRRNGVSRRGVRELGWSIGGANNSPPLKTECSADAPAVHLTGRAHTCPVPAAEVFHRTDFHYLHHAGGGPVRPARDPHRVRDAHRRRPGTGVAPHPCAPVLLRR